MTADKILGDICGFMVIIVGIFLLNAFKDLNISFANLPSARKDPVLNGDLSHRDRERLLKNEESINMDNLKLKEYHDDAF